MYLVIKAILSALVIVAASEIAKRSPTLGALVISLPLVSIMAFVWLWIDIGDNQRIADTAQATLWFILPTLPMFLVLPWMLRAGWGFWLALMLSCALTATLYLLMVVTLKRFGITL